jgi:hypothetical protein
MRSALVFISLLLSLPLVAQQEIDSTAVVPTPVVANVKPQATYSSARYLKEDVGGKKFDEKKWKEVAGGLQYDEEKKEPQKDQEPKKGNNFNFSIDPENLRLISFVIIFVLFAFILYYVAQNTKFKQKIKKMTPADAARPVEDIEELDTDGLLRQALAADDLRMAVRVQYLLLLKKLNEVGLIAWKKDKTNRDYLSELYGRNDCYENVRGLTLAYELVWYGERKVSDESFRRLSVEFESVNSRITQVQPEA